MLLFLLLGCTTLRSKAEPHELRVLVLNMHAGADADGVDNLERVAALVQETRADLAFLQEVDVGVARSRRVDQPAALARRTGMQAAFGRTLDYQGGRYGIALLSRWPLGEDTVYHLPVSPVQTRAGGSTEPRGALVARVDRPTGPLLVVDTHLDASREDTYRRQEADSLVARVRALAPGHPLVLVGGDFNSTPESAVQQGVRAAGWRDAWLACGRADPPLRSGQAPSEDVGAGFTYPASKPIKRIDYLFLVGDGARCTRAEVLPSEASDHRGVLFVLSVP